MSVLFLFSVYSESWLIPQLQQGVLPVLSSWVLVLLKLLLATVSAGQGGQQQPGVPPIIMCTFNTVISKFSLRYWCMRCFKWSQQTLRILMCSDIEKSPRRWSRPSSYWPWNGSKCPVGSIHLSNWIVWTKRLLDAMKFHHLGQILLDTNCLLLILKMLGLQEISQMVVSKADLPENKFVTLSRSLLSFYH